MAAPATARVIDTVVVHPLVLLSCTDHYNRVARDTQNRRVVGLLLGESFKGRVDVTNSFAVVRARSHAHARARAHARRTHGPRCALLFPLTPSTPRRAAPRRPRRSARAPPSCAQPFEEDARDASIFFLDHDYLETMLAMFRKVAARERVVGFYSTGPRIRPCDLAIDALVRKYCSDPVFVIVDVRRDVEGLPTQAYVSSDTVVEGRETLRTFNHVPCEVGAFEAEEVGVEHMLRDINDPSVSALGADVRAKLGGLKGLLSRLGEISSYLAKVSAGQLPPNIEALYLVQQVLALLPNLSAEPLRTSLFEVVNDQHLMLYAASLVRAVTSLHDLVANKQRVGSLLDDGDKAAKDAKDKDAAAKKEGGAGAGGDKEKEKEKEGAAKDGKEKDAKGGDKR